MVTTNTIAQRVVHNIYMYMIKLYSPNFIRFWITSTYMCMSNFQIYDQIIKINHSSIHTNHTNKPPRQYKSEHLWYWQWTNFTNVCQNCSDTLTVRTIIHIAIQTHTSFSIGTSQVLPTIASCMWILTLCIKATIEISTKYTCMQMVY
jgi:hypothetical protein